MAISSSDHTALLTLLQTGRFQALETQCRQLLDQHADDGRVWLLFGAALLSMNRDQAAVEALTRASATSADNAAVWDNLGLAWHRVKAYDQADACFRRSVQLQPDRLTAWLNWAVSAGFAGDHVAAEAHARAALQLNPKQADAWLSLGNALMEQRQLPAAEQAYLQALRLRPQLTEAVLSLAMLFDRQGRLEEAVRAYEYFLRFHPDDWRGHAGLGKLHSDLGRAQAASASYRRAIECDPTAVSARSGLLFLRLYEEDATGASVADDHRRHGAAIEAAVAVATETLPATSALPASRTTAATVPTVAPLPDRPLKLGFVSGDLREHVVAHFLEPVLAAFDRRNFSIHLYASHPLEDAASARLRQLADQWRNVSRLNDAALAACIQADGIDILIDLAGHSSHNRLGVFPWRPAPVQVSWLGYPATTGMSCIDYRPIYAAAAFPDIERQFTEQVVRLPCAPIFRPDIALPAVGPLPALQGRGIRFASLNRSNKLGDRVIRVWARILQAVPNARLLLGAAGEPALQADLSRRFGQAGIRADRLEFRPRLAMADYLELHNEVDILLDPFPFSGLATSLHAISMGVPLLTLAGDALVKRQGVLVNASLGLDQWIARDETEYIEKAIRFAADLPGLAELRAGMRERLGASPLARPELEARCLGAAFRAMWQRHCAGQPPAAFEVSPPG